MEDNKRFELNDEMLDNVAGGKAGDGIAVTDEAYAGCPFPHNSIVRSTTGKTCMKCYGQIQDGLYQSPWTTAKIRYSYVTPPSIIVTCTRCGQGFMPGGLPRSIIEVKNIGYKLQEYGFELVN